MKQQHRKPNINHNAALWRQHIFKAIDKQARECAITASSGRLTANHEGAQPTAG